MPDSSPRALLSIHDVMPRTLEHVDRLLTAIDAAGHARPVTLLVVPDTGWDAAGLDRLRNWVADGCELAGHGWHHDCGDRPKNFYHKLHSIILSHNVAEHLSRAADEVTELIARNHAWFAAHDLPSPELYVPPAWAMGALPRARLAGLPFRYYEYLSGVWDAHARRMHRCPVIGYEANRPYRAPVLRLWNAMQRRGAARRGVVLRVGIHPFDLDYPLAAELLEDIARDWAWSSYRNL